jgi:uncharacterized membrane protein
MSDGSEIAPRRRPVPVPAKILGGFPDPDTLAAYEKILPAFGQILVDEAARHREALEKEEERAHILAMQRLELEATIMKRGQLFGFLIGIIAILAGSTTATLGAPIAGAFIGGGGVIGLVTAFVAQSRGKSGSNLPHSGAGKTIPKPNTQQAEGL